VTIQIARCADVFRMTWLYPEIVSAGWLSCSQNGHLSHNHVIEHVGTTRNLYCHWPGPAPIARVGRCAPMRDRAAAASTGQRIYRQRSPRATARREKARRRTRSRSREPARSVISPASITQSDAAWPPQVSAPEAQKVASTSTPLSTRLWRRRATNPPGSRSRASPSGSFATPSPISWAASARRAVRGAAGGAGRVLQVKGLRG